jgi:LysM repeat protein
MQQVKYICKDVHTVKSGDTLYTISQNYNVHIGLLMRVNRIINPYNLRIGTKLCIPVPAVETPTPEVPPIPMPEVCPVPMPEVCPMPAPERPTTRPTPKPETKPAPTHPSCKGTLYMIARGDTLYMIAKRKGVSLKSIMDANPDIDPYNMKIGDKICIPR